jgi:LmbE family N-acetylglucosaminyl deacetylase
MTILCIVAHPDDEVLGCGGTMAQLVREGYSVTIAILGEGMTSRYQQRDHADMNLVQTLQDCTQKAANVLGAEEVFPYNLPDNRFDTVPLLDIIKIIEALIERVQPQVIYTHHGGDLNIDHVIVHRAVLTATRPAPSCPVKTLYTFEVPSATDWAFGQFQPMFCPNVFMNITSTLETKIEAMNVYKSESRPFPHPRSPEALRALARHWGSVVGFPAAEAFELIWEKQNSIHTISSSVD